MGWGSSSGVDVDNITIDKTIDNKLEIKGGAVTSALIQDGTIVNADISASAGIVLSKLASGTSAQIIVCNASGVPTFVSSSGDVTVDNTGAFSIGASKVTNAMISATAGIVLSKLASGTSAQIIVCNASGVPTFVTMSGAVSMDNAGATTIVQGLKLISTQAWTNNLTGVTFSGLSGQKTYLLVVSAKQTTATALDLFIKFNNNTGANYGFEQSTNAAWTTATGQTSFRICYSNSNGGAMGGFYFIECRNSTTGVGAILNGSGLGNDFNANKSLCGNYTVNEAITSITVSSPAGNSSGTVSLFEVAG